MNKRARQRKLPVWRGQRVVQEYDKRGNPTRAYLVYPEWKK